VSVRGGGRAVPGGGPPGPRRRVAVIFGGRSAEHEISVASARSVIGALEEGGHDVVAIGIDKRGRWHRVPALPPADRASNSLPSVREASGSAVQLSGKPGDAALVSEDGSRQEIDVVFPMLHGPFGEDGTVQGMLELAGVPYVGAGVLPSAIGMDKAIQKVLFAANGLPVGRHVAIQEREWETSRDSVRDRIRALGLPVFVKPATLGSSVGISKVKSWEDLAGAMEEALSYARKVVVEVSAEGAREIECAVLGNDEPRASVPGEIIPDGEWYDYRAKYVDRGTKLEIPARLDPAVTQRIQLMAVAAFRVIDGTGMARVDFFYREPDDIVVNEINTIPGFTTVSMYPKMWAASGVSYPALVDRLVELAIERHEKERKRARGLS
jgi:D-alanine-D-alanine ligase